MDAIVNKARAESNLKHVVVLRLAMHRFRQKVSQRAFTYQTKAPVVNYVKKINQIVV